MSKKTHQISRPDVEGDKPDAKKGAPRNIVFKVLLFDAILFTVGGLIWFYITVSKTGAFPFDHIDCLATIGIFCALPQAEAESIVYPGAIFIAGIISFITLFQFTIMFKPK